MNETERRRKGLVEMLAANIYLGDHHVEITMDDAAILAANLAPLVEQIVNARVAEVRKSNSRVT